MQRVGETARKDNRQRRHDGQGVERMNACLPFVFSFFNSLKMFDEKGTLSDSIECRTRAGWRRLLTREGPKCVLGNKRSRAERRANDALVVETEMCLRRVLTLSTDMIHLNFYTPRVMSRIVM